MKGFNIIEFLMNAIPLLLYVFANFRITRLIYDHHNYNKALEAVAYAGCCLISVFIIFEQMRRPKYNTGNLIIPYFFVILCQFGILFLYNPKWKQNLRSILKLFSGDFLFAELFVLIGEREFFNTDWQFFFIVFSLVKLIAVLLLESAIRRREQNRIAIQMQMYQHQMEVMEQSQAQIRCMRHDMKNHLLHMNNLLINGDNEKLRDYIQEASAHLDMPQEFIRSSNRDIDSIINYKLLTAQQLGAKIVTNVKIPIDMQILPFDLNVILGNLLDNALDALQTCDERRLTVSLHYETGVLHIFVQNTCACEPPAISVKGAGHGIGLHSIRRTLEAYHGELKTNYQNHVFTASILMYLKC